MKCPNCLFPMKYYYNIDEPYIIEYCKCPMCNIVYNPSTHSWNIPNKYERVTVKQQDAINFINNVLNQNFKPVLKSEATDLIKNYLSIAIDLDYSNQQKEAAMDDLVFDMFNSCSGFCNEFCNG